MTGKPGGPMTVARTHSSRSHERGERHLKNAVKSRAVSAAELGASGSAAVVPATSYVLSIEYWDSNYGGITYTNAWSGPCSTYGTVASNVVPSWNDKISSVHAYSGCATTLFWNSNGGQPSYAIGVDGAVPNLGAFNDKASSHAWSARYPVTWP